MFAVSQIDWRLKRYLLTCTPGEVVGEVVHIFKRVINIDVCGADRFITIATARVVQAPDMMKTKDYAGFEALAQSILPKERVYLVSYNQLLIGDVLIDLHQAELWSGRFIQYPAYPKIEQTTFKTLQTFVKREGKTEGILKSYQAYHEPTSQTDLSLHQDALKERLALFYHMLSLEAMKAFIGLGVGLTPSGDDFILGLISVFHYYQTREWFQLSEYKVELLRYIETHTTRVSYHMLHHILRGETNEALKRMIEKENNLTEEDLIPFLGIGQTSGTDMLVGVLVGYEMINRKQLQGGFHYEEKGDHRKECLS